MRHILKQTKLVLYYIFIFPIWSIFHYLIYLPYFHLFRKPYDRFRIFYRPYFLKYYRAPRRRYKKFMRRTITKPIMRVLDKHGTLVIWIILSLTILLIPHIIVQIVKIRWIHRFFYRWVCCRFFFWSIRWFFTKLRSWPRLESRIYLYMHRYRLYDIMYYYPLGTYFGLFCINYEVLPFILFVFFIIQIYFLISVLLLYIYFFYCIKFVTMERARFILVAWWGISLGGFCVLLMLFMDDCYPYGIPFDYAYFTCDSESMYLSQFLIYGFDYFDKYFHIYLDDIWILYGLSSILTFFIIHFYLYSFEKAIYVVATFSIIYPEKEYYWLDINFEQSLERLRPNRESRRKRKARLFREAFDAETERWANEPLV